MARSNTKVNLDWRGKQVYAKALKQLKVNAEGTGMFVETKVVKSLSRDQPVKRGGGKGRLIGLKPSKANRPPKILYGTLRESISHRVKVKGHSVSVYIGANTPYARALELGNPPYLAPRPYLVPAITKNRKGIIKRMTKNMFRSKGKKGPKK